MLEANMLEGLLLSLMLQFWLATMNSEVPFGINTFPCNQAFTELHDMVNSDVFHTLFIGMNSTVPL